MSLTSIQRDQARYKGGDEIRKRKSYLKRTATSIRQLVAILAADNSLPGCLELDSLRTTRWVLVDLARMARASVDSLARTCARLESDPAEFANDVTRSMNMLRVQHADLITELNTLAVAKQLEETA